MNQNTLYAIIAVLGVALAVMTWLYVQERNTSGIDINMGNGGISVETH